MNWEFFLFVSQVNCEIPPGTHIIQLQDVLVCSFISGSFCLGAFLNISALYRGVCHCPVRAVIYLCCYPGLRSTVGLCKFSEIIHKSCAVFRSYACQLICLGEGYSRDGCGRRLKLVMQTDAFVIRSCQLMFCCLRLLVQVTDFSSEYQISKSKLHIFWA